MNAGFVVQHLPRPEARYRGVASSPVWPLADMGDETAMRLTSKVNSRFGTLPDGRFSLWLVDEQLAAQYARECGLRGLPCRVLFIHSAQPRGDVPPACVDHEFLGFDYVSPDLTYSFIQDEVIGEGAPFSTFSKVLNDAGMFTAMPQMDEYLRLREEGSDLESIPSADVVAVYACRSTRW